MNKVPEEEFITRPTPEETSYEMREEEWDPRDDVFEFRPEEPQPEAT